MCSTLTSGMDLNYLHGGIMNIFSKYQLKYLVVLSFLIFSVMPVKAATWNLFNNVSIDKFVYFFDSDTVTKKGSTVTVWTKSVYNPKYHNRDNAFSRTGKTEYSCLSRKFRFITSTSYDRDGVFISTDYEKSMLYDVVPDTVSESLFNIICASNFPKDKSGKYYYHIKGNDVLKEAASMYKFYNEHYTDLAPTINAKWNVF